MVVKHNLRILDELGVSDIGEPAWNTDLDGVKGVELLAREKKNECCRGYKIFMEFYGTNVREI